MPKEPPPHRRTPPYPPPPPPPELAMASRVQRFKLIWRVFMISNLGLGAYIFAKAKMKDASKKAKKPPVEEDPPPPTPVEPPPPITSPSPDTVDFFEETDFLPSTPIADLVKVYEPIPDDQQRELFEWILEEKRKVKPTDKREKKKIDEDKAILKRFIRAEMIPPL